MIWKILLFLGLARESEQAVEPTQWMEKIKEQPIVAQLHHQKAEISKEELVRQEKKKIIWSWDLRNMLEWAERQRLRRGIQIKIPEDNPSLHFRYDIDRAVAKIKAQTDLERWQRYARNIQDVLSRVKKEKCKPIQIPVV